MGGRLQHCDSGLLLACTSPVHAHHLPHCVRTQTIAKFERLLLAPPATVNWMLVV